MPPREGRPYDRTASQLLKPVHHQHLKSSLVSDMNVKLETSPASSTNDSLLNGVSHHNTSESRRKAHKTRQRQQRKCPDIATQFYCPWSMAQSALGLGFISKSGPGMSFSVTTPSVRSPSPSLSDIVPITTSSAPVPSPPVSPFESGISLECRQRLGLSFGGNPYEGTCSSPDSESSSPTDCYIADLNTVYPDLKRKNASWNESYPNPSCCSPGACISASQTLSNPTEASTSVPAASSACCKVPKVTFSEELVAEQMFEDDEESKASRIGCWTIDAERFRNRIKDTGFIISPVLHSDHRQKVYQRLFCCHSGNTSSTESQPSPTSSDATPVTLPADDNTSCC